MSKTPIETNTDPRKDAVELVHVVDSLSEETKDLALNLALYLAKAKNSSEKLKQMEPEFIRLVNSTVKVIQELTTILNAAKNQEKMVYQLPSGRFPKDHLQTKLESIANQCNQILASLNQVKDILG